MMTNTSLKDQLEAMAVRDYPYVRRDKGVRARILGETDEGYLIETVAPRSEPIKRYVSRDYFDNNYWEGKD